MKKYLAYVLIFLIFAIDIHAEVRYTVIDLGTVLDGGGNYPSSINNQGQIVGTNATGAYRAVLYDATGQGNNIYLGKQNEIWSQAVAINNVGQIVGWGGRERDSGRHATLFDASGHGSNLELVSQNDPESQANGLNDSGTVVGWQVLNGITYPTSFDITGSQNNKTLGLLPGGNWGEATSVNNAGQIAGYATNQFGLRHGVLFDSSGQANNLDLGVLPGWSQSGVFSINSNNIIVGASFNEIYTMTAIRATLFDPTGQGHNIDLGTLGGNYSRVHCVNSHDQIVGMANNYAGEQCATLFDKTGVWQNNIDLNALIDPTTGWKLQSAASINDNGWIVGYGLHNGQEAAFLLTPIPEPCTLALIGLGGLLLKRRGK